MMDPANAKKTHEFLLVTSMKHAHVFSLKDQSHLIITQKEVVFDIKTRVKKPATPT